MKKKGTPFRNKNILRFIFILLFLGIFFTQKAYSTHVAGSDFCIQYISSQNGINRYLITFKVIRDNHGVAMPNSLGLIVKYSNGDYDGVVVEREGDVYFFSDCDERFEVHEFTGYLDVPEYYSDFTILPEGSALCCRNNSPFYNSNGGGNYYTYITVDNNANGGNSTPCFQLENNVACIGAPFSINLNNMLDVDGDILDISIVNPLVDENTPLSFNPGYDYLHPCQTLNNMGLVFQNGVITFTPVGIEGNTVIAIKVKEIRNGIVVGETIKEFTIIVKNCVQTAPYSLGIENMNGAVKSQVSNFEISTCVNEKVCFQLKSYDKEHSRTKITVNTSIDGADYIINSIPDSRNEELFFCWTPSYQDFGLHKFSYCVTDVAPCGLDSSLTKCYEVYIQVDGCKQEDWCHHPCAPDLGKLDVMFQNVINQDIVSATTNHPLLINVMNATGYSLLISNRWNDELYFTSDYNPNGLDWREYEPSHPYAYDWIVKWDGYNNAGQLLSSSWVFPAVLEYWNCKEKKRVDFGIYFRNIGIPDPNAPIPIFYTTLTEIPKEACCKQDYVFISPHTLSIESYDAINSITAKENARVLNTKSVFYTAGNSIVLLPDFAVEAGGLFIAKIEQCKPLYESNSNKNTVISEETLNSKFGFKGNEMSTELFKSSLEDDIQFSLVDISGKVLLKNVTAPMSEIAFINNWAVRNFAHLASGVYFLVPNSRHYRTIKFVIY